ncbi:MAG: DegT/DnrJ/EryC1/StrS family aminotransferase [Bacillota bacterium]
MKGSVVMEIGGDFCFADIRCANGEPSYQNVLDGLSKGRPVSMLASGRTAYLNAWLNLKKGGSLVRRALLPSYLCYSMLSPFHRMGVETEHYRVFSDLSVDTDDLMEKAFDDIQGTLVVTLNYFGFPDSVDLLSALAEIRRRGGAVVYDATHSALCERPWPHSTFEPNLCIMSLRKSLPVVDGAVCVWLDGSEPAFCGNEAQLSGFHSARALAMMMKSAYVADGFGNRRDYVLLFAQAEAALDSSFSASAAMSPVSRSILKRVGIEEIRRVRRRNFRRLLQELATCGGVHALISELPEDAVPLGFPVVVEDRDLLWRHLEHYGIHADIHWELPPEVPEEEYPESAWLARRILTLPCDQRYSEEDMARMARVLKEYRP